MPRQPDDLDRFFQILLGISAVATFVGGVFLLVAMSSTSVDLLSRVVVAVMAVLLLGWLDTKGRWLAVRRRPFRMSGPGEVKYWQYEISSGVLLLLATLVLVGLALLLP